ncbi:MAG TPA: hypothetical protein VFV30_05880 [Novosphingobium sp.]|nr:hypothetical protein [Novosphingobium sp.]
MAHDHIDQANDAIAATVRKFRPSNIVGWNQTVPAKGLNMAGDAAWMGFLGEIVAKYRELVGPCTCPDAETFADFKSKRLGLLRDALTEATQCA